MKATAASTGGAVTVMESVISQGPPRHVHTHEDECFYVLAGTVAGTCGDEAFEAPPGSFVFLPRGLAHTFRAHEGEARLLLIAVPGGIEHYFGEINNAASAAEQERIGDKYEIRVVLSGPQPQWQLCQAPPRPCDLREGGSDTAACWHHLTCGIRC